MSRFDQNCQKVDNLIVDDKEVKMKILLACVLSLVSSIAVAGYPVVPTFQAIAKHPIGNGQYMLVIPGYNGYPLFVDADDQQVGPPAVQVGAPSNFLQLANGKVVLHPNPIDQSVFVQPLVNVVHPSPIPTAATGPGQVVPVILNRSRIIYR